MTDTTSTWDDIRRLVDELRLELHLATMEARDRWEGLQPRLGRLEQTITESGTRAGQAISQELSSLGQSLRELLDDIRRRREPQPPAGA